MSSDEEDIDSFDDEEEEEAAAKPKRRKKKPKKDPNKPKRNMSAFFLYSNANRERVKEENPEAKFGDIVSVSTDRCCVASNHFFLLGLLGLGSLWRACWQAILEPIHR